MPTLITATLPVLLFVTMFLTAPVSATAASLFLDESGTTVDPTWDAPNIESVSVVEVAPESWRVDVQVSGVLDSTGSPDGLELLESATGPLSDSFGYAEIQASVFVNGGPTVFHFEFFSDDESGTLGGRAFACLDNRCSAALETGDFQLAIVGVGTDTGSFDIYIKSGGEGSVPEPSTLLLLLGGIAAAAPLVRRRIS